MKILTKKVKQLGGHTGPLFTLLQPGDDNEFFSGGSDKVLSTWRTTDHSIEKAFCKLPFGIYASAFVAENNTLWLGQANGGIHIIDLDNKQERKLLQTHKSFVFDIQQNKEQGIVISTSADGSLAVYDAASLSLINHKNLLKEKVRKCSFSADGTLCAIARGDGFISIFSIPEMKEVYCFQAHELSANVAVFHPTMPVLISGGRDAHLKIWDAKQQYALHESIPAHNYAIYDIAFHPNKPLFATASRDKTIKIWHSENGRFLERIERKTHLSHAHSVNTLLWSTFANYLISTGDDGIIMIWETEIL